MSRPADRLLAGNSAQSDPARHARTLPPSRIVITGAQGFLGQYLTARLLEQVPGAEILLLDIADHPRPTHDFARNPRVSRRVEVDVCDPHGLRGHLSTDDVVVHLAGVIAFARRDRERLLRVNVGGTRNVLDAATRAGARRLVHVSSVAALGYRMDDTPIDEDFRFDWAEARRLGKHYMLAKRAADDLVRSRSGEIDSTIVYPGLMMGPGDRTTAAKFVAPVASGRARLMTPGGTNIVDVRDVARGIAEVVRTEPPRSEYLLSGANVEFAELAREIATVLGKRPPDIMVPGFMERVIHPAIRASESLSRKAPVLTADGVHSAFRKRYYTNARARADFGWSPEIAFQTTIRETVQWLLQ